MAEDVPSDPSCPGGAAGCVPSQLPQASVPSLCRRKPQAGIKAEESLVFQGGLTSASALETADADT